MGYNYSAITGSSKISRRPDWVIGGSGLQIGGPPSARRAAEIKAHGKVKHQFSIFRQNQLSRIGHGGPNNSTMFSPNADGISNIENLVPRGYKQTLLPFSGKDKIYTNGIDYQIINHDNILQTKFKKVNCEYFTPLNI